MKRLLIAALLASTTVLADDGGAKVQKQEEDTGHQNWPSVNELWNETETGDGIKQALVNGTVSLDVLLAYEYSDLDNGAPDAAHAMLTRTRLNYKTGQYKGFGAFVQAQYVAPLNDHFAPEDPTYDEVADPEAFRFHQAYLTYSGYDSDVKLGAQEIILDNARLIGNVGWRLNAQSFKAASIANQSVTNLTLFYAYADSINAFNGEMSHARQYHLLNAEYDGLESSKVAAFAYLQKNDGAGIDHLDTFGVRAWGDCSENLRHDIMLAAQRDAFYGSAFAEVDADAIDVGVGVEYISGGTDDGEQFQTLNGTAHKFNGWADQFAGATSGGTEGGLVDIYGQISGKAGEKLKLMAVYHWFNTAEETAGGFSGEYGQEIDLLAKYPVCPDFDLTAKCAIYMRGPDDPDNITTDETVFWLRGALRF